MPSLKDLLELMNSSWPVALAILLAGTAILIGYELEVTAKYVSALPTWLPGAAFIAVVLGGSVLAVAVTRLLIDLASVPFRRHAYAKQREAKIKGLHDLSDPEKGLLIWAFANRTRVFSAPYFHPVTKALVTKNYLLIPPGSHHTNEFPFEIPEYVWTYMKENVPDEDIKALVGKRYFDPHGW